MSNTLTPITSGDRLSFTMFLSVALNAAIILGFTFERPDVSASTHTMEVTLAHFRSQEKPAKADYLAQFNQLGSGTLEKKALTTSPTEAEFKDTTIKETQPLQSEAAAPKVSSEKNIITTVSSTPRQVSSNLHIQPNEPTPLNASKTKTLLQRSLEIASLEARLDRQRQNYAKRPRIKRLTSLSTSASSDAYYLNSWRRKIEKIGNLNYPAKARKERLFGSLRLLVAIRPDGSLKEVSLLESSGHKVLDDAALSIVKLAAPFAPFPDELRKSTDVLEIIRTWQFRKNSSLASFWWYSLEPSNTQK